MKSYSILISNNIVTDLEITILFQSFYQTHLETPQLCRNVCSPFISFQDFHFSKSRIQILSTIELENIRFIRITFIEIFLFLLTNFKVIIKLTIKYYKTIH